ncbi:TRAP transporter small permease [Rossellomorea aquimaris]|jgi:C4-dicarboxylate transporter, DctQ subunit|uniref:C4-dicarboxylate ABC transporter permease n=1 Tax=Rossellomorea aquimaris TaxID=189382 RepID=A0A1J6WNJ5_9BACI|nr:TRAP transporter small permease [Rossellomorea aquimaris]OIU69803.1 C4-dicarboxylate ABC transporter permease [Rossellomorea aquimaris]
MKKKFDVFEETILVLTLALMVALIFSQVVGRYVFSSAPSWTEEMARYIHIFQVWIGASYAVKKRQHIRIESFIELFKGTARKVIDTAALLIWFLLALFLAVFGTQLVLASLQNGQVTPAMQLPMWVPFLAIPLGGAGMALRLLQQLAGIWRNADEPPSREVRV